MTENFVDIQAQRRDEKHAAVVAATAPAGASKLADLRERAEAAAAALVEAESERTNGYATIESLLEQRAEALAQSQVLETLVDNAKTNDSDLRAATERLVEVIVHPDDRKRAGVLAALDGLIRVQAIASLLPGMLEAKSKSAKVLGEQIVLAATRFKISLPNMSREYQKAIDAKEGDLPRCIQIVKGFAGLLG